MEMTKSTTFAVILLFIFSTETASVEDLTEKQRVWNEAYRTCQRNNQFLPKVQLSEQNLQLADQIHWNENECFWVGATYEYDTHATDHTFPIDSCEIATSSQYGSFVFDWTNCENKALFLCAPDDSSISMYKPLDTYLPWRNAFKVCRDQGLLIPSKINSVYLAKVISKSWWINSRRHLNLSPSSAKNGDSPICFCNQTFMSASCPSNSTTLCLNSTNGNYPICFSNQTFMSAECVSTSTTLSLNYSNSNINTTESIPRSTQPLETSSKLTVTVTSIHNGALIGGLTGAAVLLISVAIVAPIIVIMIRRKRRAMNYVSPKTLNDKKSKNVPSNINTTAFGDDFNLVATNAVSSEIQTVLAECSLQTRPPKVMSCNTKKKDDQKYVVNSEPFLYVSEQDCQGMKLCAGLLNKDCGSDKEYEAIVFQECSVSEISEHVYD